MLWFIVVRAMTPGALFLVTLMGNAELAVHPAGCDQYASLFILHVLTKTTPKISDIAA